MKKAMYSGQQNNCQSQERIKRLVVTSNKIEWSPSRSQQYQQNRKLKNIIFSQLNWKYKNQSKCLKNNREIVEFWKTFGIARSLQSHVAAKINGGLAHYKSNIYGRERQNKTTPDNFCPNICLSTTFKLWTRMIASNMYLVSKSLYCIRRNLKVLHVQKINCWLI